MKVNNPKLTATNPHFKSKFAPLGEVLRVINEALPEGWVIDQTVGSNADGEPQMCSVLRNEKGVAVKQCNIPFIIGKSDPQGLGSALTYHRRYGLCLLFNLVGEDDDDGNAATPQPKTKKSGSTTATDNKSGFKKVEKF